MGARDAEEMLEAAKADAMQLERAVRQALELHPKQTPPQSHLGLNVERCPTCGVRYPCQTREALEAAL